MDIPTIDLSSGYTIPCLGLGTWRLTGGDCTRTVRAALDMGYTHIDTADMYDNHREVGAGMLGFERSSLFLTTKVAPEDLRREDMIAACERSLLELGTEYIDMLLVHWPNRSIPMGETLEAMSELAERALIRSAGVSNFVTARLEEALQIAPMPICVNQVEFHPLLNQDELLEFCRSRGVVVTAYAPLGRTEALGHPVIVSVARETGRTPAQVCLKWLLGKGIVVIPKTGSVERLRENMGIFDWQITAEQEARIDAIEERKRLIHPDIAEF